MIPSTLRGPSLDFSLGEPQSDLWACRPAGETLPCVLPQLESVSCKNCGHDLQFSCWKLTCSFFFLIDRPMTGSHLGSFSTFFCFAHLGCFLSAHRCLCCFLESRFRRECECEWLFVCLYMLALRWALSASHLKAALI